MRETEIGSRGKLDVAVEKALLRIGLEKARDIMERGDCDQETKDLILGVVYPLLNCCFDLLRWIEEIENEAR